MSVQSEFISRLAQLLEFAETHRLEVPVLALNAAFEAILPNLVQSAKVNGPTVVGRDAFGTYFPPLMSRQTTPALQGAPKKGALHLHLIDGGLV